MNAVSEHALIKRINRRLADVDEKLKTARSARAEQDLGRYFIVDIHHNSIVDRDVQLKALGHELGVLHSDELVVSTFDTVHLLGIEKASGQAG